MQLRASKWQCYSSQYFILSPDYSASFNLLTRFSLVLFWTYAAARTYFIWLLKIFLLYLFSLWLWLLLFSITMQDALFFNWLFQSFFIFKFELEPSFEPPYWSDENWRYFDPNSFLLIFFSFEKHEAYDSLFSWFSEFYASSWSYVANLTSWWYFLLLLFSEFFFTSIPSFTCYFFWGLWYEKWFLFGSNNFDTSFVSFFFFWLKLWVLTLEFWRTLSTVSEKLLLNYDKNPRSLKCSLSSLAVLSMFSLIKYPNISLAFLIFSKLNVFCPFKTDSKTKYNRLTTFYLSSKIFFLEWNLEPFVSTLCISLEEENAIKFVEPFIFKKFGFSLSYLLFYFSHWDSFF